MVLLGTTLAEAKRALLYSFRLLCSYSISSSLLILLAFRQSEGVSQDRRGRAAMAMSMKSVLVLMLGFAMAATSSAIVYKVGDTSGWTIPGNVNYADWAVKKNFSIDDIIEFQYPQGIHNVLEVKKAEYDSCTNSSPIATHTSGDDKITIKRPGHRFFICGVPGHCAAGQKVNIRVLKQQMPSSDTPSTAPAAASPGVSEPGSASTPSGATTAPAPHANGAGVYAGFPAVVAVALAVVASTVMLQ